MEIETEEAFGVKFWNGLWPCSKELLRADDS
jgi:hypothetical protein